MSKIEDYDNHITAGDIQLATEITRTSLDSCDARPVPIPAGSVNKVFRVTSAGRPSILRFSAEASAYADYQKEAWCIEQARARGVPTPEIVQIGQHGTVTFMFQRFVAGVPGTSPLLDRHHVWSALGAHLSTIHTIPTQGFGLQLQDATAGQFTESWERHLSYNLSALGSHDLLQQQGIITPNESALLTHYFTRLGRDDVRLALSHGDIALRNAIVDPNSSVHLLDWGCSHSHVVPYSDFANILRWEQPTRPEFATFLEGTACRCPRLLRCSLC